MFTKMFRVISGIDDLYRQIETMKNEMNHLRLSVQDMTSLNKHNFDRINTVKVHIMEQANEISFLRADITGVRAKIAPKCEIKKEG